MIRQPLSLRLSMRCSLWRQRYRGLMMGYALSVIGLLVFMTGLRSCWTGAQAASSQTPPTIVAAANARVRIGIQNAVNVATVNDAVTPRERLRVMVLQKPDSVQIYDSVSVSQAGAVTLQFFVVCAPTVPPPFRVRLRVTNEANLSAETDVMITPWASVQFLANQVSEWSVKEGEVTYAFVRPTFSAASAPVPTFSPNGSIAQLPTYYGYSYYDDRALGSRNISATAFLDEQPLAGITLPDGLGNQVIYFPVRVNAGEHRLRLVLKEGGCIDAMSEITIRITASSKVTATCVYPTFAAPRVYEANTQVSALVAADFNGDQRADLAVCDRTNRQLKTYLGQTNGELTLAGTVPLGIGVTPYLRAADLTGDGKLDLALNDVGLTILRGVGDGTFAPFSKYPEHYDDLSVGDINGDGALDCIATSSFRLRMLLNDGKGQLRFAEIEGTGVCGSSVALVAGLICSSASRTVAPYYGWDAANNRMKYLGDAYWYAYFPHYSRKVFGVNLNGYGHNSLAITYGPYEVGTTLLENGFYIDGTIYQQLAVKHLAIGDFNRDGSRDVVVDRGTVLLSGLPRPFCSTPELFLAGLPAAGDVNGDGRDDVVMATATGLQLYLNQTTSTFPILKVVSGADYSPWLAPEQIVTMFGQNLASTAASAQTTPLPTTLAGVQVRIGDNGAPVPLFYVSPTQINFQLPKLESNYAGHLTIWQGGQMVAASYLNLQPIAPALFTANATGRGLAAAQVLRILANGTQRYEPIARYDEASKQFVAVPIDVSNASEQVFLVLYGTGIRGRSALSGVTTTIGGAAVETLFAGAQGSLVGLDQVNIRLPRTLAGRGEVDVAVTVDGKAANVVRVNLK